MRCQQDGLLSAAMLGDGQAGLPELELVANRCSKVPRKDFDPMLVEVDACLAKP
jgi:hypothetical protein